MGTSKGGAVTEPILKCMSVGTYAPIARLVRKFRGCHVQYDYDTRRAFPLHEALVLTGSVTL